MATLEDLDIQSISDLSYDEGLELLRQLRLSRRTPKGKKAATVAKNKQKKESKEKKVPQLTPDQAKQLLALLTGGTHDD